MENEELVETVEEEKDKYSIVNLNKEENNIRFHHVLLIILIYTMSNIIGVYLVKEFMEITSSNMITVLSYANLMGSILSYLFLRFYIIKSSLNIFRRKGTETIAWVKAVLIPIYFMLTLTLPSTILNLFGTKTPTGEVTTTQNQELLTNMTNKTNPIAIFLMIVILAPIIEEILFRGIPIFYKSNRFKFINTQVALIIRIIIASLIFGSLHMPKDIVELIAYSSASFVLSMAVLLTNKLEYSIGIHMANNLLGFIALII